jgi:hypothetical protein
VLGLNNSALARGTPLALRAAAVDKVLDDLLESGHVRRPFIGVAVQPVALSESVVKQHGLEGEAGLLIISIRRWLTGRPGGNDARRPPARCERKRAEWGRMICSTHCRLSRRTAR